MGRNEEEGQGRLAGIMRSLFSKNREAIQPAPPPRPPPAPAQPDRNLEELNLIKQRVQGASQSILERKPFAGPQTQPPSYPIPEKTLATPLTAISSASPASAASPAPAPAFGVQLKPHEIQESVPPAAGLASQPKLLVPSPHASSSASAAAQPKPYTERPQERKSRLDEIRDSIEESAKRKDPAHLKKNIEEVNEHLRYVKRKSALSEKKIEKIVDEKVREELAQMSSSLKEKIRSNPPQAEKEQLESLQRKLLELMDISDRRSELEMEHLGSQMDSLRRQITNIPSIITQREISEISPLKGEVAFLRDELRKHLSQISDPGEREKIADTLGRAEALYKRFEYNPQEDLLRSELEEIKSRMGEFAGVLEKAELSRKDIKDKEILERESLKKELSSLQDSVSQIPSSLAAEAQKFDSIRKGISELRGSVQQIAGSREPAVEKKMLGEILAHLSSIEQRQAEDEKKLSRLVDLDSYSLRGMDGIRRRIENLSRRISSSEQADMDAFREELRALQKSVGASISTSKSEEEQELLSKLHGDLSRIVRTSEGRSAAALGELKGELEDVRRSISHIPSVVGARERPEFDAMRSEVLGLQKMLVDALAKPKNEEERRLLRGLYSRLEGLFDLSDSKSAKQAGELRGELADVRRKIAGIPLRVEAGERADFDALRNEIVGLHRIVGDALSKPRDEEEKILLKGMQSRLEGLLGISEQKSEHQMEGVRQELGDLRKKIATLPSRIESDEKPEIDSVREEINSLRSSVGRALAKPKNDDERMMLGEILSRLDGMVKFFDVRAGSALDSMKTEIYSMEGQLEDIRSEKADIDSIGRDVRGLGGTLKKVLATSGRKDRELVRTLSDQISGISDLLDSKAGAAADNLRKELDGMRNQIMATVSAEMPEIESVQSQLMLLSDLVEKALAKPTIRELNSRLDALRNQIGEMLEMAEAKTGAGYEQLKQSVSELRNGLEAIPVELAAEKPEIDSMKSTVESLQKMLGGGEPAPPEEEIDTGIPAQPHSVISDLKDEISSIKGLLETRGYAPPDIEEPVPDDYEERVVPLRRKKTKPAGRKKAIAKKAAKPAGKKAGRIAKRKPKKSLQAKPRVKKPKKSLQAKPRVKKPKKSPEPRQRVKKSVAHTAKKSLVKPAQKRSGTRLLKKLLSARPKPAPSAKRKPASAGKPEFNYKRQRVRSDVDSFIEDIERRRKAIPEIERRLGGEYATGRRREHEAPREKRRFERGPGTGRKLERESDAETPEEMLRERESESRESLREREGEADARETMRERKGEALHERELEAKPEEGPGRLHEDYDSYLKAEKLGKVHSDVKRMHQRLKDIRKLYEEEA